MNNEIIVIAASKGGVGKSTLAINIAIRLAQEGKRPLYLFDDHSSFNDVLAKKFFPDLACKKVDALSDFLSGEYQKSPQYKDKGYTAVCDMSGYAHIDMSDVRNCIAMGNFTYLITEHEIQSMNNLKHGFLKSLNLEHGKFCIVANRLGLYGMNYTKKTFDKQIDSVKKMFEDYPVLPMRYSLIFQNAFNGKTIDKWTDTPLLKRNHRLALELFEEIFQASFSKLNKKG